MLDAINEELLALVQGLWDKDVQQNSEYGSASESSFATVAAGGKG